MIYLQKGREKKKENELILQDIEKSALVLEGSPYVTSSSSSLLLKLEVDDVLCLLLVSLTHPFWFTSLIASMT